MKSKSPFLRTLYGGTGASMALLAGVLSASPMAAFASTSKARAEHNSFSVQQARNITVSGTIIDARTKEPIIGASVIVVGKRISATTDTNGRYTINAPEGSELQVAYIGYKAQTAKVNGSVINFEIKENEETLSEAVVVGYGSQKKVNLTGSVAQLDSKALEDRPIQNVQAGIQGMLPGVTVSGTNGAPGMDGGNIRVRGVGTFNTASPYILVDGVEAGTMSAIDPNDIESISVLKDAASAAIYGSKASNGVILITTKKGKSGKPKVTYSGYVSVQNTTNTIERLSSYEYAKLYNEALDREGKAKRWEDWEIQKFKDGTDPNYPNTDWYDLAYKTGVMQRHNISVNGGNEYVKYLASVGYLKQTGIMPNAGREQFNGRTNLEMNITKKLKAKLNLAYIKNDYTDPSSAYAGGSSDQIIRQLNLIAPWVVARYDDGTWGTISDGSPIAWLDNDLKVSRKNTNFSGLFGLSYDIIDGLNASINASYVNNNQNYSYFQKFFVYNPNKQTDPNSLDERVYKWERSTFEALLNYDKSFGMHNVKALAGWHAESYDYKYWYTYRKNFPNNGLGNINAGDASTQLAQGVTRELNMISWFGRVNYDYAGKYLFEANVRADASSRFAKGQRWGYFPSFSAGWRISEESFMEGTRSWLSNLKLRASWGQLGNQEAIDDYYPAITTYNLGASYPFDGALNPGIYQSNLKLNTITWEKATTWGIGLDMGFLNNRLNVAFDYYNRKTTDIIMQVDVPAEFGLGAYLDNVGSLRNQGIELNVTYNDKWGDWTFSAMANMSYNKNEILTLSGVKPYIDVNGTTYRNGIGHEFQSNFLYKADGFFNSEEEAQAYMDKYFPAGDPDRTNPFGKRFKAGDLRYVDTNNDGKINSDDRVYCNSSIPAYTFGLNLTAGWKGIDLSLFFNGQAKASRYFDGYEVYGAFTGDDGHPASIWKDSWRPDHKNATMPRIATGTESPSCSRNAASTFWLEDVSYVRLKNLQIGYTLPKNVLSFLGVQNLRVYYSVENLFTIDNMRINIDPEATSSRLSSYPLLRTHAFGLTVTF